MDFKCDELILGKKDADSRALTLDDAVGIMEVVRLRRCIFEEFFLVHGLMLTDWEDLSTPESGSRDDRLTFSCQCHLGEQLLSNCSRCELLL